MSERSQGPAEPSREAAAMWERTRDLGKRLDGLTGRLETLEGQGLADALAELSLVVKKLAEKPAAEKGSVWNWQLMTVPQQAQAWELLLDWMMNTLRVRYPRSFQEMLGYGKGAVSCWHLHPDLVESLTGLMCSWHWAFTDPDSGPMRVAEWLDRWLPGAVRQGRFILENCNVLPEPGAPYAGHKDPLENKRTDPAADLLQHIHLLRTGELPN
ncbi:hypothetical protein [Streptomyces sp. LN325]|uniref:hypothetical protein n=1 Tax=Streptomyces sp. LN325 TaxID=3112976 RepID=UPI00371F21C8